MQTNINMNDLLYLNLDKELINLISKNKYISSSNDIYPNIYVKSNLLDTTREYQNIIVINYDGRTYDIKYKNLGLSFNFNFDNPIEKWPDNMTHLILNYF